MDLGIKGKKALVTGGATGIGYSICKELAKEDVKVIFTSRDKISLKKSEKNLRKINPNCYGVVCDVTKPQERKNFSKIKKR